MKLQYLFIFSLISISIHLSHQSNHLHSSIQSSPSLSSSLLSAHLPFSAKYNNWEENNNNNVDQQKRMRRSESSEGANSCGYTATCANVGEECNFYTECLNSACNITLGVCVPLLDDYQACSKGQGVFCKSKDCAYIRTSAGDFGYYCITPHAGPGHACTYDSDCIYLNKADPSFYTQTCSSGKCTGVALGGACDSIYQCNAPNFCSKQNVCTAPLKKDQTCDPLFDACEWLYSCTPNSNKRDVFSCKDHYALSIGDACSMDAQCQDLAFCNDTTGHCESVPSSSSYRNCNSSLDCGNGEVCTCAYGLNATKCVVKIANPVGITSSYKSLSRCVSGSRSCLNEANTDNVVCSSCNARYCDFFSLSAHAQYDFNELGYPQCYVDVMNNTLIGSINHCQSGNISSGGAVVVVSFVLLMVLGVLSMLIV